MTERIGIYGTGGHAREVLWTAQRAGLTVEYFVIGHTPPTDTVSLGLPCLRVEDVAAASAPRMHVAIGNPAGRGRVVQELEARGFSFATLIDPSAVVGGTCSLGDGTYIGAHSVLTTDIVCGRHVQINVRCSVSHDCRLGDFVTLGPGVTICGNVHVMRGALLGAGCTVSNGTSEKPMIIGADAVVGAGAVVIRDVAPGETVVGVPARARSRVGPQASGTSW